MQQYQHPYPHLDWLNSFFQRTARLMWRKIEERDRAPEPRGPRVKLPFSEMYSQYEPEDAVSNVAYRMRMKLRRWALRVRLRLNHAAFAPGGPGYLETQGRFNNMQSINANAQIQRRQRDDRAETRRRRPNRPLLRELLGIRKPRRN